MIKLQKFKKYLEGQREGKREEGKGVGWTKAKAISGKRDAKFYPSFDIFIFFTCYKCQSRSCSIIFLVESAQVTLQGRYSYEVYSTWTDTVKQLTDAA